MKINLALNNWSKSAILGVAVLLASTAFASNKGSMIVHEKVEVGGQELAPGEYQVRWSGTGSDVQVSFSQGKREVMKTAAKVVSLAENASSDSAIVDHENGKASISEVRFAGKKFALAIGPEKASEAKAEVTGGK